VEEIESVDREFQESKFVDEEFEHECIKEEDPLQGFVDWVLHQPTMMMSMRKIQLKNL
jgi:hypothetical protein